PRIATIVETCQDIALVPATPADELGRTLLVPREVPGRLQPPPRYTADFDRRWSVGSFSALVRALPAAGLWASSIAAVRDDETLPPPLATEVGEGTIGAAANLLPAPATAAPTGAAAEGIGPWHRFP